MTYVTGMIGDRAYTLTLGGTGGIQGDENILNAFDGVNAYDEATALAHCRKLFGDTMQVREESPAPIPGPFLADNPAKGGDPAMASGGILHREDVVIPPVAPGSASMASTAENVPTASATATPPVPAATTAGKK